MDTVVLNALVLAMYPYLIVGALGASIYYGWAAWKLRETKIQLWWLSIGITLSMGSACAENLYWAASRLAPNWPNDRALSFIAIPIMKAVFALGAWMHLYVAVSLNTNPKPSVWFKRSMLLGSLVFLVTYPILTYQIAIHHLA